MKDKMEAPMGCITYKYPRAGLLAVLLAAVLIFGCSSKVAQKDPFLDKWSTMAETQTGSSPAPRDRDVLTTLNIPADPGEVAQASAAKKSLPTQKVSLKMRQADVKTVLRSLARIVDRNILVKNEIKGEITVDFQNTPWNQAFTSLLSTQGLTYVWEGEIIRVMTFDDMDLDLKRKTQDMGIKWVAPMHTVVVPIDYAKPKDLKETLESFLTPNKEGKPRGSVRVDEFSNSLVISAIRDDLVRMMEVIKKIDKPTSQIQIKANIVETTKEMGRQLGIQWGGSYSRKVGNDNLYITPGGTSVLGSGGTLTPSGIPPIGLSGQGLGLNFPASTMSALGSGTLGLMIGTIGGNILEMQLNALQKDSKLNILSSPSITTLDNQMAFTENGERVPVNTQTVSSGTISNTTTYIDAVLRLEIKPHVIDDKTLSMKIIVKKDEVDASRQVFGNPYIIKKQTETNLIVRNGETIVISGLTKQRNLGGDTGLPGVKDIPVLGWLFKSDDRQEKMEEVLIFITPTILPPYQVSATPATATKPAVAAAAKPAKK